jgi:methylglutaconyl-CoA hydratase
MQALTVRQEGVVAYLTLNRPEVRNAFGAELIAELTHQVEVLDADSAIRVLVLQAEGNHFSAGADLNWMRAMKDRTETENRDDARKLATLMQTLDTCRKPLVGVTRGAAMGGGVGLLACCDIVLASKSAFFALSEVRLGLTPATISPFVVRAMGARQARRYFQTGERFTAQKALDIGLVHEVVDEEDLPTELSRLLGDLTAGGPEAQAMAKTLVKDVAQRPVDNALMDELAESIGRQRVGGEGQEGLTAFLDKRNPNWIEPS